MHGVIFSGLKRYVGERFGEGTWEALLAQAGLEGRLYAPISLYPDEELDALVAAACEMSGLEAPVLLQDFGAWIIPSLIGMYKSMIPAHWGTVEFLLNVEDQIHEKVIKMKNPQARPPKVRAAEIEPGLLLLDYTSHRNMCDLAIGCAMGVATFYGDRAEVEGRKRLPSGSERVTIRIHPGG